jgi:hypothetical protein
MAKKLAVAKRRAQSIGFIRITTWLEHLQLITEYDNTLDP